MKTGILKVLQLVIILLACTFSGYYSASLHSQTILFSDPGETYTNTDGTTNDFYGPIDISACFSIHVSVDYSFSLPWEGSGNMETSEECNFSNPCDGDPTNPAQAGCEFCWDFLWVVFLVDGVEVGGDLIGEAGTTDLEQSGTIEYVLCVDGESNLDIEIYTQTWAGNESVTFSNITVSCYNDLPIATADPNPVCSGNSVQLDETSGNFTNWTWAGPNGYSAGSKDPILPDFTSSNEGYYVVTAEDANGCPLSDSVEVLMHPQPDFTVPTDVSVCEGLQVDVDTLINPSNPGLTYTYHDGVPPTTGNEINGVVSFTSNTTISVVGTDANTCADTQFVNLTVIPVPLAPPVNNTGPFCEGDSIQLSAAPPIIPGITYSWTGPNGYMAIGPEQYIPNATPADAGTYELRASLSGCISQPSTVDIVVNPLPAQPSVSDPVEVCYGDVLQLSANSDPGASYNWTGPNGFGSTDQNPIVSNSATFSDAGTYTVTPSLNNCAGPPNSLEVIVLDTPMVQITIKTPINCPGDNNGILSVDVPGGVPPYNYDWSDNQYDGQSEIAGLPAGTYSVTVTDGNGCQGSASLTLEDPPTLELFCDQVQGVSDVGASDGIGEVFIVGGTSPYTIIYDNNNGNSGSIPNAPSGSNMINNLAIGTYQITVIDSNGCEALCTFTITAPGCDIAIDSVILLDSVHCFGDSSASLKVFVSGGSGNYIYEWGTSEGTIVSDSSVAVGLTGGAHYISVKDANDTSCSDNSLFYISQPFPLRLRSCSAEQGVSGPGAEDGVALINFSGGTSPYIVSWSGAESGSEVTTADSLLIDSLRPGTYNVILTDNNGCTDSCTFLIRGESCNLSILLDTAYFTSCPADSSLLIETSISMGTNDIIYIWNGDTLASGDQNLLASGLYTIQAVDTNTNCRDTLIVDKSTYQELDFRCLVISNPSEPDSMNGEAAVVFTSVAKPYNAIIYHESPPLVHNDQTSDTLLLNSLDTGTYTVVITDSLGCTDSCSFTLSIQTCSINLTLDTAYFDNCPSDSSLQIHTSIDGSTSDIIYIWNGDTLSSGDQNGLTASSYTINALDTVSGCSDEITVSMPFSNSLSFNCAMIATPTVKGGRNGIGGIIVDSITPPFDVFITGHSYSNSQLGVSSDSVLFNNLDSGLYSITVVDSFGCMDTCSFYMPDGGCDILSVDSVVAVQPDCNNPLGGSLEVFASGGSGNYDYNWNVDSLDGMRFVTNLGPGTYNLTVTDLDLACVVQASHTLFPVEELIVDLNYSSSFCIGDSAFINIEITSGSFPLDLQIEGGNSLRIFGDTTVYTQIPNPQIELTDSDGCNYTETLTIEEIAHVQSILDTVLCENDSIQIGGSVFHKMNPTGSVVFENGAQNGCDSMVNVNLTFEALSIDYDIIPPSCELGTNTQIELLGAIGTTSFSFIFNGNEINIPQTPYLIDGLESGEASIYIQSERGCVSTPQSVNIEEPDEIEVNIADVAPIQAGDSVTLEGQTTADPFIINWSPEELVDCDSCLITSSAPEESTTYILTVTDQNGCTGQAEVTVILTEGASQYYIPNVFSPNGDNINDYFTIYARDAIAEVKSMRIYDRWGNLLYEALNFASNVEESGWDGRSFGTTLNPGVYIYAIELVDDTGKEFTFRGSLTLLK